MNGLDPVQKIEHIFNINENRNLAFLIAGLIVYFTIPIVYVIKKFDTPAIKTRSPTLLILCFVFLGADTISNSISYAFNEGTGDSRHKFRCDYGIFAAGFFFGGGIIFYVVRMYRIYKFYTLYEMCLIMKSKIKKDKIE